jgi:hypothetical protein
MSHTHCVVSWYAACRALLAVPEPLRRHLSRQTLALYRRIRKLPPELGEELDRRAAPLAIFRWVAWGAGDAEQRARHAATVEHHARTGRWPGPKERTGSPREKLRAA